MNAFVDQHWDTPIPPQGEPPDALSAQEARLDAATCADCHPEKHRDWQQSQHSKTMNAGIKWQLHLSSPEEAGECLQCHAPLAEQQALIARKLDWPTAPDEPPPEFIDSTLHQEGVTCASCHVREHQRFGPPPGHEPPSADAEGYHQGSRPHEAYENSRFCAECHQFPEDGPKLDGKLRQNTYREWQDSAYSDEDVHCQDCHMPDGRHEWHGITDRDALQDALTISLEVEHESSDTVRLVAEIANTGAGHYVPTYMVPRIDAELRLRGPDEKQEETVKRHTIQWRVTQDLSEERFDQRIPPGESVRMAEAIEPPQEEGWKAQLAIRVAPKEHYERIYRSYLSRSEDLPAQVQELLEQALADAERTRFTALVLDTPLDEDSAVQHQGATPETWEAVFSPSGPESTEPYNHQQDREDL